MAQELAAVEFPDERLKARLGQLLGDLGTRIGHTLPAACQDWTATKAAYRFFDNPRVDEQTILGGHFAATAGRFAAATGTVLMLHDTTEFSFARSTPGAVGYLSYVKGQHRTHTACGLLLHSSLAVTTGGRPLGLAAVTFWTRKTFKGTEALRGKVNATRIPVEAKESVRWLNNLTRSTQELGDPARCVHVGDREADLFELFDAAHQAETHFLVRTCVDRLAGAGGTTVARVMARQPVRGVHEVEVRDAHGTVTTTTVAVRFCRLTVHPPVAKRKRYGPLSLTVIHACKRGMPAGREPIRWKLLTDLPVDDLAAAVEKLDWYALRWSVETFHKVLKSGCLAERAKLRTTERLTNLLAVAKLGGYLARTNDPPPGNLVVWRGLTRLADLLLGFELGDSGSQVVGN